jgi:hypothetical protein
MKLKGLLKRLIVKAQHVVMVCLLFLLYVVGFGITVLFALVFDRKLLGMKCAKTETFWQEARGYSADMEEATRQS